MKNNEMVKTILLGDDEQHALLPLKLKLHAKGYRVLEASTVEVVLELLKATTVDLVIIDIMMDPGESLRQELDAHTAGAQALPLIKQISPRTKIICLSVISDHSIMKMVRKSGALFVSKGETSLRKMSEIIESKITGIIEDVGSPRRRR
jgi:DNA-binding NarL/FixJ family response regulator